MTNQELKVKKERFFKVSISAKSIILICFYLGLIFLIWYIIEYNHLDIYLIDDQDKSTGYLFTILVSIMLLLFLVSCGFIFDIKQTKYRLFIFIFILYLIIQGFTSIGFGFRFNTNFGLLVYENYESNTYHGIKFFTFNFVGFFIWIFIISLFFESEKE